MLQIGINEFELLLVFEDLFSTHGSAKEIGQCRSKRLLIPRPFPRLTLMLRTNNPHHFAVVTNGAIQHRGDLIRFQVSIDKLFGGRIRLRLISDNGALIVE